ncbi:membrane-bound transcription factor site-2 protease [Leptopilina boulardi]|uniref:membrane-bound transcription factor site-2 protease n=1 Tax=Leptopilina boulardi TaxID=63433 RepID=UPI0021F53F22|nr:membrane-bound transcription factor site-2 protease [Leptopilina boulardi]XP_051170467.1 membrane-bound transcription factor site-2 protease [Leptopilina boulardi]
MDSLTVFAFFGLIHCLLYFIHTILTSYSIIYVNKLKQLQLGIEFLRVKWFTSAFNESIKVCAKAKKQFWHLWFDVGVCVTLLFLPVSIYILTQMTINIFNSKQIENDDKESLSLQLMVPGFNIPINDLGYYIFTLFICSTFHELGHAIAAISEDVRLYGLGFFLAFIVPVAYVQLCNDKLLSSSKRSQLRIMCAGIWHNCVLSAVALILLSWGTSLYKPFYFTETGVSVRMMTTNSPLIGVTGLTVSDTIYKINDCSVKNDKDWSNCILSSIQKPNPQFCVSKGMLQKSVNYAYSKSSDCCDDHSKQLGHLCFDNLRHLKNDNLTEFRCLPARAIITKSSKFCSSNEECADNENCLKPLVENDTKIVQIKRKNKLDVLFIGYPIDISRTVLVSNWVSKFTLLSSEIPETLTLIYKYIVMFSSGLVVINLIPCFYFDGHYIVNVVVYLTFKFTLGHQKFYRITCLTIKIIGTSLLFGNIFYMIFSNFFSPLYFNVSR